MHYCEFAESSALHKPYHDHEYGFIVTNDDAIFERLMLEVNQAGLSWTTILQKRASLQKAYADFSVNAVAQFDEKDVSRLLADTGVIRHRLKVQAAIHNAQAFEALATQYGSVYAWLNAQYTSLGEDEAAWVRLFKQHFRFTGGETTKSFLLAMGYLPDAHHSDCPIYPKARAAFSQRP